MKKAFFLIKKRVNGAINNIMSMEDRIDYAVFKIDESILKFANVRSKLKVIAHDSPSTESDIEKVEGKIKELYNKKKELNDKKASLIAKEALLKAQLDAAKEMSGVFDLDDNTFNSIVNDCDQYIKNLEAELDTFNFMNSLK